MACLMNEEFTYERNKKNVGELFETPEVRSALADFSEMHDRLSRFWKFDSNQLIPKLGPMFASESGRGLAALILRTHSNVESLLSFEQVKHFQAIAMLARTILETPELPSLVAPTHQTTTPQPLSFQPRKNNSSKTLSKITCQAPKPPNSNKPSHIELAHVLLAIR